MTKQWVAKNNLDLIGMLEPRIQPVNIQVVETGLGLHGWKFISNESQHPLCRILIGWNPQKVTTSLVSFANQRVTMVADLDGYSTEVQSAWETGAIGNPISRLSSKLRALKGLLSKLHKNHSNNISSRVERAKEDWQRAQLDMERDTSDASLGQREGLH
ncbi:hypothetical protein OIU79_012906 [Salix purpurea]|uniref:Uncharacterized protein n=1 Tax=Salix purpurea TaxID=77065 RepID=A0A9Q0Q4E4_SALPP|nr:hypothetical protein OIU79_012906 [Salix purpurea]